MASNKEICKMVRVVTAAKTLDYAVHETNPMNFRDINVCLAELSTALEELDGWENFDPRVSLEFYKQQQTKP